MARQVIDISRRQMLRGIGGATLALPILPSLLSRTAYGADPVFTRPPRLYWVTTDHGGAFEASMFPSTSLLTASQALYSRPHRPLGRAGADDVGQRHGAVAGAARAVVVAVGGAGREDERAVGPRRAVLHRAQHRAAPRQLRAQRRQRRRRQGGAGVPAPDHRPDHGLVAVVLFEPVRHPRARDGHVGPAGVVELQRPGDDDPAAIQNVRGYSSSLELFNKIFVPQRRRAGAARADRRPACSRTTTACARATGGCRRPTSSASTITSRASPSCSAS